MSTPRIPLPRWIVTFPTVKASDDREVRGIHVLVVEAIDSFHATELARAQLQSKAAKRHRRDAEICPDGPTVTRWQNLFTL